MVLEPGLVAGLSLAAQAGNPRELTSALSVPAGPGERMACIGTSRARDLAVNVVLPFLQSLHLQSLHLHGLHQLRGEAGEGQAHGQPYLELYRRFSKLQDNDLTREMAGLLLGGAWAGLLKNARRQQGLWASATSPIRCQLTLRSIRDPSEVCVGRTQTLPRPNR